MKAYALLSQDFTLPAVRMHLHKIIPMGAGLGGGSADAAFVLKALNATLRLNIGDVQLEKYAARLGSDCAFFIRNRPAFASGRGELLEDLPLDLSGYHVSIVKPPQSISTKEAFSRVVPAKPDFSLRELASLPVKDWKHFVHNDFEASVFGIYPAIGDIKQALYASGAIYASLSGSGSAVYGLFSEKPAPGHTFSGCEVFTAAL